MKCRICGSETTNLARANVNWCVRCSVGQLLNPYRGEVYDDAYAARFNKQAKSDLGQSIYRARLDFLHANGVHRSWLDFGCGVGAMLVLDPWAYGFEPSPAFVPYHEQAGIEGRVTGDEHMAAIWAPLCQAVAYFDSLEHVSDPLSVLATFSAPIVVVTAPVIPTLDMLEDGGELLTHWKHYRPDEHLWYATFNGVIRLLDVAGYEFVDSSDAEARLGRQDVITFAFKRKV